MNDARAAIDGELLLVLRVGQARHEANAGDRAVGPHVAIHAGGGAQRGVARLAGHHYLLPVLVHQEVACGRPLDPGVLELAEPVERDELRVVPELRHHGNAQERQAQHIEGHQRAVQGEHVGESVGDRLHPARRVAAFPDDGVAIAARLDLGALVDAVEKPEEVAVLLFFGDFVQVEGHGHSSGIFRVERGKGAELYRLLLPAGRSRLSISPFEQGLSRRVNRSAVRALVGSGPSGLDSSQPPKGIA